MMERSSPPNKDLLQEELHQVLRQWQKPELPQVKFLTRLRLFNRLATEAEQSTLKQNVLIRQLIEESLEKLQERDETAANLLRQRYLENTGIKILTRQLAISESQFYKLQNEAIGRLADLILEREKDAQFERQLAIEARLEPLGHQALFGIEELRQQLAAAVTAPDAPWVIAVEGLGGIGKTSLADQQVRTLIPDHRFFDIAWVSARRELFHPASGIEMVEGAEEQPTLPVETLIDTLLAQLASDRPLALTPRDKSMILSRLLKQQPYLIVIDNLETVADYQALLPSLRQLADPSKFLLTSRHSLRAHSDVFCLNVSELGQADATALLRHEAQVRGVNALAQASPAQLEEIYEVVGGNPLALKLVIGQIQALPLSQVLASLRQAQGRKITELYTYIYWQSWKILGGAARQALLAMPVASPRGSPLEHLSVVSELELAELGQALEELVTLSLVEVGGDLENRRYSIHRLTETFLLTEVVQWPLSA